ncbi:MAG TPA: PilZ domain-containing protein [Acidothermaceae bacterium]|nr:PilZ domain-containing protein [Acidothermaceae bacterium]
MNVQPEFRSEAIWMTIGSAVTLLPVELDGGLLAGEVTHWLGGPAGVVATIGVRTTADVAAVCAGQRLWLSGHAGLTGELIVLEVIAREASRHVDTTLTMTGVLPLARERRRDAVRAATRHPVRLTFNDGTSARGIAADLSRSGCLIALNEIDLLRPIGTAARLEIELPGNESFSLEGAIVRVVGSTGEVAVHFQPSDIDLAPVDRVVYASVKRENGR